MTLRLGWFTAGRGRGSRAMFERTLAAHPCDAAATFEVAAEEPLVFNTIAQLAGTAKKLGVLSRQLRAVCAAVTARFPIMRAQVWVVGGARAERCAFVLWNSHQWDDRVAPPRDVKKKFT